MMVNGAMTLDVHELRTSLASRESDRSSTDGVETSPPKRRTKRNLLTAIIFVFIGASNFRSVVAGEVAASYNADSESESTAPTIPIPDGYTALARANVEDVVGEEESEDSAKNKGSPPSSRLISLYDIETFPPCTIETHLDYKIIPNESPGQWAVCFELVNVLADWAKANKTCFRRGGHLARPLNSDHALIIESMLRNHPVSRDYWIDANDMNTEGEWRWSDGGAVPYVNWRKGRPINSTRHFSRDCAELHRNFDWQWNDKDCVDKNNFFVCQHRVQRTSPTLPSRPASLVSTPSSSSSSSAPPSFPSSHSVLPFSDNSSHFTFSTDNPHSVVSTDNPQSTSTSSTPISDAVLPDSPFATTQSNPDSFKTATKSALFNVKSSTKPSQFVIKTESTTTTTASPTRTVVPPIHPWNPPLRLPTLPPDKKIVAPAEDILSPSQIGLLVLCLVTIVILTVVVIIVAVPTLRMKIKLNRQGSSSSPSSPSSSIESQTDSSLNSSSTLSSITSSQQPWTAVLKCFSSQHFHPDHSSNGSLPTVTTTMVRPNNNHPTVVIDHANDSSNDTSNLRVPTFAAAANPSSPTVANSFPDRLPSFNSSPRLPTFTIKRKRGGHEKMVDDDDDDVHRRPPNCGKGVGVSNPVFMADVFLDDDVHDDVHDDDEDDGTPNFMGEVKLEMTLDKSDDVDDVVGQSYVDDAAGRRDEEDRKRKSDCLPVTSRNIFMKEILGSRQSEGKNTFKYEKF